MTGDLRSETLRDALAATGWRDVEVRGEVDSTNDLLLADPRPWRVVTADHQTRGRGRLDRTWEAPAGASIALSATVPLPRDTARWGWVPLLVGLAVRRGVARVTGLQLGLKWPNDLLVQPHSAGAGDDWCKVAGILCSVAATEAPVVVVGIGLNVHQRADQLPVPTATSLALCGASAPREELIAAILVELAQVQRGWSHSTYDAEYRSACVTLGQRVRLETASGQCVTGRAADVDSAGRLVIEGPEGRRPYSAGDVVHVRPGDILGTADSADSSNNSASPAGGTDEGAGDPVAGLPVPSLTHDPAEFVDALENRLMGNPRTMRRAEISQLAGVPQDVTEIMWRSLGFARARDEEVFFGDADLEALRRFVKLSSEYELDPTTALGLARAVGRSTDRMAMWALQLIADMESGDRGGVDSDVAQRTALLAVGLAEHMSPLVDYVWRRNLSVAISRMVADAEPESQVGIVRTVGFADLVNFTQLVRQLSERELARLVLRFESLASDMVSAHGGAVVKTVGDEVLFTHTSVRSAIEIAFDLRAAAAADDLVPPMRVGMAHGRVLARLGDVYGTTVNRASRLTGAAKPGSVLVDSHVMEAVANDVSVRVKRRKRLELQGLGPVEAFVLDRPAS